MAGAHQNRHVVQRVPPDAGAGAGMEILDFFADPAGLGLAVPMADQADLKTIFRIGPQRLAEPPLIGRDQPRGRRQNMRGRAVVLFQPDYLRAREILFEPQDVADLGTAPAIDRLVIIAHNADIVMRLRQEPQPQILRGIGVLIFVDEDIAEAFLPLMQDIGMGLKQSHAMHQEIAEIDGIER